MTPVFQGIQHRKNTQSKYVNKTETKQKQRPMARGMDQAWLTGHCCYSGVRDAFQWPLRL